MNVASGAGRSRRLRPLTGIARQPRVLWTGRGVAVLTIGLGLLLTGFVFLHSRTVEQHQRALRHRVDAVLLAPTPAASETAPDAVWDATVALVAPDGRRRTLTALVNSGLAAGAHVPVWVYRDGRATTEPQPAAAKFWFAAITALWMSALAACELLAWPVLATRGFVAGEMRGVDAEWAILDRSAANSR